MYTIVVTDDRYGSYAEEKAVFNEIGAELRICNFKDSEEAKRELRDADGILVNLFPMNADIIGGLEKCRVISRYGVGCDNVDIQAATERGIQVCRVPDYCSCEAADHTVALLLAAIRNTVFRDRSIRAGGWNLQTKYRSRRIAGRTHGLIGFGQVGRGVCRRLLGFGLEQILVYDPYVDDEVIRAAGAVPVSFDRLIEESDYISIHAPSNSETARLFNGGVFEKMKPGMIVVNTARGRLVDEDDLCAALDAGIVAAAALDVFEKEPLPENSRLRSYDSVVLSDHTAYYSEESLKELKTKAARNIVEILTGQPPTYPVNTI